MSVIKHKETISLQKKKLADKASELLNDYKLGRKQRVQCKEIIRDYEKYRAKQTLFEFKK